MTAGKPDIATPQRRAKTIGQRCLTFVGSGKDWWLQEGERRIPLHLRETESTLTNSRTHHKEIRARQVVTVAPLGHLALSDEVQVHSDANGTHLVVTVVTGKTVIYNTAMYEIDRLELSLAPDWSRAELWIDHHTDMSD
jgi:hypothetical protein